MKWADVLRGNTTTISDRGVHSFHRYLVKTVAADKPMTEFARELLTAQGNTLHKPAANFFRMARTPEDAGEATARLFLGVRVQCAKCHNHPFERTTQTDYFGIAAFFAQVRFKGFPAGTRAFDLPEGGFPHPLLQAFSKPVRDQMCECAREDDPGFQQVLHLLNNAGVLEKVRSPKGRVAE